MKHSPFMSAVRATLGVIATVVVLLIVLQVINAIALHHG